MIYTLEDISRELGVLFSGASSGNQSVDAVRRRYYQLVRYRNHTYRKQWAYRSAYIPKKSGGMRRLQIPCRELKRFQRYLLELLSFGTVSERAAAYVKGRTLIDHGALHVGKRCFVRLDIRDFFGSVRFRQVFLAVEGALRQNPNVSLSGGADEDRGPNELIYAVAQFCTLDGALPQGAPTSPLLSNLVFFPLDQKLEEYCIEKGISYSRYADDLYFSGDFEQRELIRFVRSLLRQNGFLLNEKKTVIAGPGQRHRVTGIVVNERMKTEASYRRKIRQEIYYIGKYGIVDHLRRMAEKEAVHGLEVDAEMGERNSLEPEQYLRGLQGRIGFVLQVEPGNQEFIQYQRDCCHLMQVLTTVCQTMVELQKPN